MFRFAELESFWNNLSTWLVSVFHPKRAVKMVLFGQVVVGPPGAGKISFVAVFLTVYTIRYNPSFYFTKHTHTGKTTYCSGMKMFITELGRKCEVVNLDFANDTLPYKPAIDVRDLISLQVATFNIQRAPQFTLLTLSKLSTIFL